MKTFIIFIFILISMKSNCQVAQTETDWANFKRYANENQELKPTVKGENRIVFMGNSITELWKVIDSSFFMNKPYIDRGICGQVTSQMLIRFRPDVIELKPAVVVILTGINDIAENRGPISPEYIYGNIISMVELARANKIKVVISSILPANHFPWRPEIKPAEKIVELNSMLEVYCIENNIVYLDYYSKMQDEEKGLAKKFTVDGVHPNLEGYQIMEPLLEKAILKALHQSR
ncbi:MAG: SGNH/GDSL hydrolase family protein [Bacteroidota bacterium]